MAVSDIINAMSADEIKKYMHDHKNELTATERKLVLSTWQEKFWVQKKQDIWGRSIHWQMVC